MTVFKNNKKYDTSNVVYKNNYVSNYKKIVDEMITLTMELEY